MEFDQLAMYCGCAAVARDCARLLLTWRMEHADKTLTVFQVGAEGFKSLGEPRR